MGQNPNSPKPKKRPRPRHWWLRGLIICAYLLLSLLSHDVKAADGDDIHYDTDNNNSSMGKLSITFFIFLNEQKNI